jgi:hypothetical protein
VSGVPTHLDNESSLEDTNIDDNTDNQEDNVEQVDYKKEDIARNNDYGDTRKSSERT